MRMRGHALGGAGALPLVDMRMCAMQIEVALVGPASGAHRACAVVFL